MDAHILPVALDKSTRLLNHGPTVLVSAQHDGTDDVMAAAWACALDFSPPKLSVVLDKGSTTRALLERSGAFAVQIPTLGQRALVLGVGSTSLREDPDKLAHCEVELFRIDGHAQTPFVAGCSAWLACRLIAEPRNQQVYDLFIGEIVGAWADSRVFRDGHWQFEQAERRWRSLHHVAGGHFYAIGDPVTD